MSLTRQGFSDAELRARGVPDDVIADYRNSLRRWSGALRGVRIDGEPLPTVDERLASRRQWVRRAFPELHA